MPIESQSITIVQKNFPTLAEGDSYPASAGNITLVIPGLHDA